MNRQPFSRITFFLTAAYAVLLLSQPQAAVSGFTQGLLLCGNRVLPALFPFFVVSALLTALPQSRVLALPFRLITHGCGIRFPGAALILLLSWLGGYAVCARLVGEALHAGQISRRDAGLLLAVGCCSGPGFVIGCVGGIMLGSVRLGILLYALQLAANLLAASVLCLFHPAVTQKDPVPSNLSAEIAPAQAGPDLPGAIRGAVDSCLTVCGCILFFRVTGAVIESFLPVSPLWHAIASAVLEVSAGCNDFALLGGRAALWGCCACLSLLGFSVLAQIRQLAGPGVMDRSFFLSRVLHLCFFLGLVRLCASALPGEAAVYSSLGSRLIVTHRLPVDTAIILLCFFAALLYKIGRKIYNK